MTPMCHTTSRFDRIFSLVPENRASLESMIAVFPLLIDPISRATERWVR